ncbi:unnamed protein product [Phytomonas sp. Hart1]|nr:unnamed protein product [Phytomonas sp. Hart1]|eukprot:CCW69640.1 unnamed protein product [Phytomonas sp. isolate Hart1]
MLLETTPDLDFIKGGRLNMVIHREKEDFTPISTEPDCFFNDKRIIRAENMDNVTFKDCVFKVTLDFMMPIECMEETAVRETTDWVLCSCSATDAFYSKTEARLVLQQCRVSLKSNVQKLTTPFIMILCFKEKDVWVVERVLR